MKTPVFRLLPLVLASLSCNVLLPDATPTPIPPSPAPLDPTPTATALAAPPSPTPISEGTPTEPPVTEPATPGQLSFIAYVQDGQLLVTDVTGGVRGGTTQYTQAGVDDQVTDLVWSPSGEFVAYTGVVGGEPHVFYVFAVGAGTPVDLGPGGTPAWSPDSTQLAYQREGNIWITAIEALAPRPLTAQTNWAWGRPAFTPDGSALIVTGNSFDFLGAQGNTSFWLYTLPLDGSGTLTPLPGLAQEFSGRLPYDLRFSPDGQKLAFSTSFHLDACASTANYYVLNRDGSAATEMIIPSLSPLADLSQEKYFFGYSFAWMPGSDGLLLNGVVRDCRDFAGTIVGGPQMSLVTLGGEERLVVPGSFDSLSFDRSGTLIGTAFRADNSAPGQVRLYSLDGTMLLEIGEGEHPQFQP